MSRLQWGCVLYKSATCVPTALLSVKVCIKVLKARSLGFATTSQRKAAQGLEGGPCSPSILWGLFSAEGSSLHNLTVSMGGKKMWLSASGSNQQILFCVSFEEGNSPQESNS